MKACTYCGCFHAQRAVRCRGCGHYFSGYAPPGETEDRVDGRGILLRYGPSMARKVRSNPILIWLTVSVPFLVFGFFGPELMLFYGGFGFSIATCLAMGVWVIQRVRRGSLKKPLAILLAATGCAVAAMAPPLVMSSTGLYGCMSGLLIYGEAFLTVCIGAIALLVTGLWIIHIRNTER